MSLSLNLRWNIFLKIFKKKKNLFTLKIKTIHTINSVHDYSLIRLLNTSLKKKRNHETPVIIRNALISKRSFYRFVSNEPNLTIFSPINGIIIPLKNRFVYSSF